MAQPGELGVIVPAIAQTRVALGQLFRSDQAVTAASLQPALRFDPQRFRQLVGRESRQLLLLTFMLQPHAGCVKVAQAPGDANHASAISAVVEDLASGAAGQVGAFLELTLRIEATGAPQKAQTALLHQVVPVIVAPLLFTGRHKARQAEVPQG